MSKPILYTVAVIAWGYLAGCNGDQLAQVTQERDDWKTRSGNLKDEVEDSKKSYNGCKTDKNKIEKELDGLYGAHCGPQLSKFDFTKKGKGADDLRDLIEDCFLDYQPNGRAVLQATDCASLADSLYRAMDGVNNDDRRAAFATMFVTSICNKDLFTEIKTPEGTIPVAVYTKPSAAPAAGTSK